MLEHKTQKKEGGAPRRLPSFGFNMGGDSYIAAF
jgi:hypothetical protein